MSLIARYQQLAQSADPVDRLIARRQLAALRAATRRYTLDDTVSGWAHVPLARLFEAAGNEPYERANGTFVCGHEPVHASRSGGCLVIWPRAGRWWCSSCRQGGDAVQAVRSLHGLTFRGAVGWLVARYGPPRPPRGATVARTGDDRACLLLPAPPRPAGVELGPIGPIPASNKTGVTP